MSSIAELIASGDAWSSDLDDFQAVHTPPPEPAPVASVPAAPALLPVVEVIPVVHAPPVVSLPIAQEASARSSLEAALADLLPLPESVSEVHAAASAPRIQLGFRDGTSASLDPDSEQALALELLAQSLTRRD